MLKPVGRRKIVKNIALFSCMLAVVFFLWVVTSQRAKGEVRGK
jgi:hypothetical protein